MNDPHLMLRIVLNATHGRAAGIVHMRLALTSRHYARLVSENRGVENMVLDRCAVNGRLPDRTPHGHHPGGGSWNIWFRKGRVHRDGDEPAMIKYSGKRMWFKEGKVHRDGDKPASADELNGIYEWYVGGKVHRDGDEPATITPLMKSWSKGGKLHRDGDKPAVEWVGGKCEWWTHGRLTRTGWVAE